MLKGLGWVVGIVLGDQIEFATIDAAFGVDFLEIGGDRVPDGRIGGSRPGKGHDGADLDLGIARTGIVFLLSVRRPPAVATVAATRTARSQTPDLFMNSSSSLSDGLRAGAF